MSLYRGRGLVDTRKTVQPRLIKTEDGWNRLAVPYRVQSDEVEGADNLLPPIPLIPHMFVTLGVPSSVLRFPSRIQD